MNVNPTVADSASHQSSYMERLVEHVFVSEVLQEVWYSSGMTVEVLRSEVDSSGYDLVLECNDILRHVQLKTSKEHAKTARQKVHRTLAKKPGGCVVWIRRQEDVKKRRMKLKYLFFGGKQPKEPLPPIENFPVAKHTKRNLQGIQGDRPELRVVPKGEFDSISTTKELVLRLFGKLPETLK